MTLQLDAPASKSMTQRGLVIAALCDGPTRILHPLRCDDSRVLIASLRALGCPIDVGDGFFDLRPAPLTACTITSPHAATRRNRLIPPSNRSHDLFQAAGHGDAFRPMTTPVPWSMKK